MIVNRNLFYVGLSICLLSTCGENSSNTTTDENNEETVINLDSAVDRSQ